MTISKVKKLAAVVPGAAVVAAGAAQAAPVNMNDVTVIKYDNLVAKAGEFIEFDFDGDSVADFRIDVKKGLANKPDPKDSILKPVEENKKIFPVEVASIRAIRPGGILTKGLSRFAEAL